MIHCKYWDKCPCGEVVHCFMQCFCWQSKSVTGPVAGINAHGAVYRGAVPQRFGNRKPPAASYATFAPIFHFDDVEGLFIGGNFWDGRATGERLGNPAAENCIAQAVRRWTFPQPKGGGIVIVSYPFVFGS